MYIISDVKFTSIKREPTISVFGALEIRNIDTKRTCAKDNLKH